MRTLLALLVASTLAFSSGLSFAQDAATVTCKDGSTSKAGKGACSHHGGVNRGAASTSSTSAPAPAPSSSKSKAPSASPAPEAPAPTPQPAAKSTHAHPTTPGSTGASKAANTDPTGALAQCKDGTYSHSKKHSGACSHHGGVAKWLDQG